MREHHARPDDYRDRILGLLAQRALSKFALADALEGERPDLDREAHLKRVEATLTRLQREGRVERVEDVGVYRRVDATYSWTTTSGTG